MKIFKCAHCEQLVYFENTYCERCGHALGFSQEDQALITLELDISGEPGVYVDITNTAKKYRYCANYQFGVCNWLVPANQNAYCLACELNRTIPDISTPANISFWQNMEIAKHRLVYSLLRLNLPVESMITNPTSGLAFDFLANLPMAERVLTGHDSGLITINIEEADDVTRERVRKQMGEPYRTLLGHFRHEIGHYYWDRLIDNSGWLQAFRNKFGDDQADYSQALAQYYATGGNPNWQQSHISVYASSHPWEDWAESWAHYMHMMDTLETAWSFGLNVTPRHIQSAELSASMDIDPYQVQNFSDIIKRWLPFTYAMNSINRSMGQRDLYPFVMSNEVIDKLDFIHQVCRQGYKVQQGQQQAQAVYN